MLGSFTLRRIVRKLLTDSGEGAKLTEDHGLGLSAIPIWVQDFLRKPVMAAGSEKDT